jgi:subtilisin family serine protease
MMGEMLWQRIHPKLRVIANGDDEVNAARAECASCLKVPSMMASSAPRLASGRASRQVAAAATAITDLSQPATQAQVHVFIETRTDEPPAGGRILARQGTLSMASVRVADIPELAQQANVTFVAPADSLKYPRALKTASSTVPPAARAPRLFSPAGAAGTLEDRSAGVLIGIIDVDGFDFAHPDFLKPDGTTRFLSIWDQGADSKRHAAPTMPTRALTYGAELTRDVLNAALEAAKTVKVSPHDLEPQSQMSPGSHGTHVASIAAGNTGICPSADILAVLISLPPETPETRRESFYDSTRLLDAIEYLFSRAAKLDRPISINVSLGTNGHAHDGSSVLDRWIDALLTEQGRAVCVAAGNAGQEKEESPGDAGWLFGRIHTSGKIPAKGLSHDIEWVVEGNRVIDVSENELEIWYESQDRFQVSIRPPNGAWIGPIGPGEYLENIQLPDRTLLSVFNELYHPANGHNYISIYLSPYFKAPIVGIAAGTWTVRLTGVDVRDGRFHGWIERDDPVQLENGYFWPSTFSERSNVDSSSVSSLACGQRIISVANLDELRDRIHVSSSQGPTRDGRLKPDVAAPGTDILAANGFGDPAQPWVQMTGTSMASPFVAGVVGQMLGVEPRLRAAQIEGILKATARPLPGKAYEWLNDSGFGVVDPLAAIREAQRAFTRADVKARFE